MPFYGDSQNQGFYLRDMGFYWGISDRHDMTFRGDIYSTGSWGLRVTDNYNIRYKHAGTLTLGYSNFHFGEKKFHRNTLPNVTYP